MVPGPDTKTEVCFKNGKAHKKHYIWRTGRCPPCFHEKEGYWPGQRNPASGLHRGFIIPPEPADPTEPVSYEPASSTIVVDQHQRPPRGGPIPNSGHGRDAARERDHAILTSGKLVNFDSRGRPFSWYRGDDDRDFSIRRPEPGMTHRLRQLPESLEGMVDLLQEQSSREILWASHLGEEDEEEDEFI